ncbi:hypothetical protein [Nocardia gamkensis]|uniref:hypothetical protein n=1 Tax=Nocardia gamkensis TaxID=352869 RepID=UPI0037C61C02
MRIRVPGNSRVLVEFAGPVGDLVEGADHADGGSKADDPDKVACLVETADCCDGFGDCGGDAPPPAAMLPPKLSSAVAAAATTMSPIALIAFVIGTICILAASCSTPTGGAVQPTQAPVLAPEKLSGPL